ncbi:hypothetical protein [Streptomyces sp. NPDC048659]|uniref:hypothetical protein n=1 Tax=Streptomyces sp. NPDC048659 TaxID=3155489 RepID=UPI0034261065
MNENQTAQRTSVRRNRVAAAACFAAALLTATVVGTQSATADGAAQRAGAAARPAVVAAPALGSAALLQSEDLVRQGLKPVAATVELAGRQGLSACSGETTMRDLTKGKAGAYASVNWTLAKDAMLTESAASAATKTAATAWEKQLVALVQDCQDEPAGHWYYGPAHTLTGTGGTARWYTSYNGDGAVSGGVAVLRSGTKVAVVELTGRPGPASFQNTAAAALKRLSS